MRRRLEGPEIVPAAVREVQRELDDAQYAREFEEGMAEMGRGLDDPVFSDRLALYAWGELQYKSETARSILPNPSHQCSRELGCRMRRLDVSVYRRIVPLTDQMPAATGPGAPPLSGYVAARAMHTEGQARLYHLCIHEMCEHLIANHACRMSPRCWHAMTDRRDDTLTLDDFWVCGTSGNLHICGESCTQAKEITTNERDVVCTLTSQIIAARRPVTEAEAAAEQRDPRALTLMGKSDGSGAPDEDTEAARARRQAAVARGARRHRIVAQPVNEEAEYRIFAQRLVEELLFSEKRQMLEANIYLADYRRALDDVNKYMRVRKLVDDTHPATAAMIQQVLEAQRIVHEARPPAPGETIFHHDPKCPPLIMIGQALCVHRSREAVSEYFANVPMMDSVAKYITDRRAEMESEYLKTDRRQPSDINALREFQFHQKDRTEAAAAARRDYETLLGRVVQHYREAHGITRPAPTRWLSEHWQRRMANIKLLFAHTLVRVWHNLAQHADPAGRQTLAFGRIALGVLYLTKSSLEVQDLQVAPATSFVTVVPRIAFARLLPCDNQLNMFKLDEFAASPTARRLTTTQGDVRQEAMRISRMGALPTLLLRIEDVSAELAAERRAAAAVAPPTRIAVGK